MEEDVCRGFVLGVGVRGRRRWALSCGLGVRDGVFPRVWRGVDFWGSLDALVVIFHSACVWEENWPHSRASCCLDWVVVLLSALESQMASIVLPFFARVIVGISTGSWGFLFIFPSFAAYFPALVLLELECAIESTWEHLPLSRPIELCSKSSFISSSEEIFGYKKLGHGSPPPQHLLFSKIVRNI